jgi:hypothetical protein
MMGMSDLVFAGTVTFFCHSSVTEVMKGKVVGLTFRFYAYGHPFR